MISKLNYIFSRKEKVKLAFVLVAIVIGSFLELGAVAVFTPFVEAVMNPEKIQENVLLSSVVTLFHPKTQSMVFVILAISICLVYVIKNVYLTIMQNMILTFSYKMRMNLAVQLLTTYMQEPYTFHLSKNVAELQRCLQVDANQFMLLVNGVLQLLTEAIVCIALGFYLFHTSHSITVVVGTLMIICVGGFSFVAKHVSLRLGQRNQDYNAKLIMWINQALGGIKEVKVLHREHFFVDAYRNNYKKLIRGAKKNEMLATVPKYIIETVCIRGLLLGVVVKIMWGRREVADIIPQLAGIAVAAFRLLPSMGKLNAYINNIMYCRPSLDLIYQDLKEVEHLQNTVKEDLATDTNERKMHLENEISVEYISYRYPNTEQYVLDGVNFKIPKGKTVALIGNSGAGKTTMADIILGILPPDKGRIVADGWDVYENLDAWHSMLGYIPQTIYLSDDSIRNNIAFGVEEDKIDEEAVIAALEKAQLLEFVKTLPNGLNTYVGDRGVRLSGGQRQRIGIARALYHDPEILVLDEATSALDNETEHAVMESIESLQGSKTILIIAHRLTTIRKADVIYEVVNGTMVRRSKEEIFGSMEGI